MSSGHTGRGGRGNRRTRRGSQRQRGPEGQNGQTRQNSAMLLVSHAGGPAPAPGETIDDALDDDEGFDMEADAEDGEAGGDDEADAPEAEATPEVETDAVEIVEVVEVREAPRPAAMADARQGEESGGREAEQPSAHSERQHHEGHGEHAGNGSGNANGNGTPQGAGTGSASHVRGEKHGPVLVPPTATNGPRGAVPYAPGTRTHMAPQGHGGANGAGQTGGGSNGGSNSGEPAGRAPAATGPLPGPGRGSRAERDRDRGEHEPLRPEVRGEVGPLIDALHEIFAQDRTVASQGGTTRCGICYLHFPLAELEYREEEGYYVCERCARALGRIRLPMVRRQQRS